MPAETFKNTLFNPKNQEAFDEIEPNTPLNAESKFFALCFEKVFSEYGYGKVFGSKQVQDVNFCVYNHASAVWRVFG